VAYLIIPITNWKKAEWYKITVPDVHTNVAIYGENALVKGLLVGDNFEQAISFSFLWTQEEINLHIHETGTNWPYAYIPSYTMEWSQEGDYSVTEDDYGIKLRILTTEFNDWVALDFDNYSTTLNFEMSISNDSPLVDGNKRYVVLATLTMPWGEGVQDITLSVNEKVEITVGEEEPGGGGSTPDIGTNPVEPPRPETYNPDLDWSWEDGVWDYYFALTAIGGGRYNIKTLAFGKDGGTGVIYIGD
jgi:hypothetical protein